MSNEEEKECEALLDVVKAPLASTPDVSALATKLDALLKQDAGTAFKRLARQQLRGYKWEHLVSRLTDLREHTSGVDCAVAATAIARVASTISIAATGAPDVTEQLGSRGAVPELMRFLTPSMRRELKSEGQAAVLEAVSVLTIANEDNRLAMVQVGEEESESGFRRVVSCMMEAAAESPRGQAAFQAGRALRNLSYSDGGLRWHLHSAGAMDAVEALLKGAAKPAESTPDATAPPAPSTEAIRFQALQALALIYGAWAHDTKPVEGAKGGEDAGDVAAARRASDILKNENMVDLLSQMLQKIVEEPDKKLFGIDWALGPWSGPLTCRVMATNSAFALELAEKGAVELLAKGLTQADCWKPSADKPLSVRGAFDACKALLYIVMLPKAKALERVKTAKAGVLETMATFRAEFEHELFFDPDFAQPVEGICGQLRQEEEEEGRDASGDQYDVFLSHKRSDSADFARGLYNFLTLNGFKCFLDFEFRDELNGACTPYLGKIVQSTKNFLFVLTDHILESPWCMIELEAAVKAKRTIILVVKEGSRWENDKGVKLCEFPPYSLINSLPEGIRSVFTMKAIGHSNEYYGAFCELILQRLRKGKPGAPVKTEQVPPIGGEGGIPGGALSEFRGLVEALRAEIAGLRMEREALVGVVAQMASGLRALPASPAAEPKDARDAAPAPPPPAAASAAPPVAAAAKTKSPEDSTGGDTAVDAAAAAATQTAPEFGGQDAGGAAGTGVKAAKALRGQGDAEKAPAAAAMPASEGLAAPNGASTPAPGTIISTGQPAAAAPSSAQSAGQAERAPAKAAADEGAGPEKKRVHTVALAPAPPSDVPPPAQSGRAPPRSSSSGGGATAAAPATSSDDANGSSSGRAAER